MGLGFVFLTHLFCFLDAFGLLRLDGGAPSEIAGGWAGIPDAKILAHAVVEICAGISGVAKIDDRVAGVRVLWLLARRLAARDAHGGRNEKEDEQEQQGEEDGEEEDGGEVASPFRLRHGRRGLVLWISNVWLWGGFTTFTDDGDWPGFGGNTL